MQNNECFAHAPFVCLLTFTTAVRNALHDESWHEWCAMHISCEGPCAIKMLFSPLCVSPCFTNRSWGIVTVPRFPKRRAKEHVPTKCIADVLPHPKVEPKP